MRVKLIIFFRGYISESLLSIQQSHAVLSKTASASWFAELRKQWLAVLRVLRNISLLAFRFFSLASGSLISAARLYFKSQTQKASVKNRPKLCVMWLLGAFRDWIRASCESWIWRWPGGLLRFFQCVMSRQEWVKVAARCHVWRLMKCITGVI